MIVIIDYGMGNLKSVQNALEFLQCDAIISNKKEDLQKADGLILPGVGAFPDCMKNLKASNLIDTIKEEVKNGKALLGICLGMQVLFEKSYEGVECDGLGLLQGVIKKMVDPEVKIPHIGWNSLEVNKNSPLLNEVSQAFVYYVHSYYASDYREADLVAYSSYGKLKIPGLFQKDNIYAAQFHPEKSGKDGLQILRNFIQNIT